MSEGKGLSRRRFVKQMSGAIAGLAIVPILDGCDANFIETITAGEFVGKDLPLVTEAADFYNQNGGDGVVKGWSLPNIDSAAWKLTIDGQGFNETVTFEQLSKRIVSAPVSVLKTLRCVFDSFDVPGLMSTGIFTGTPLRAILPKQEELEKKGVKRLRIYGADGFRNNITLARLFDKTPGLTEPLLVTQLNGSPLPQKRGAPVRLILQEAYGFKNVKWIERIELTDKGEPFGTYQDNNFIDDGVIRVMSKTTKPLKRGRFPAGKVKIIGMAFSGTAGIEKVEVSIDDGAFRAARIIPLEEMIKGSEHAALIQQTMQLKNIATQPFPFQGVWVKWEFEWDAPTGQHTIKIKATDKSGKTQPKDDTDGTDGVNSISSIAVSVT